MHYLGIDIGGTNLVAGIVDENYKIIAKFRAKTKVPSEPEEFADDLVKTVNGVLKEANLTLNDVPWVGLGCPGTINPVTGVIEFANNLYFKNVELRKLMQERLGGKEILLENDANAAAYGEYIAGALKGSDNAMAITLGTGLGGGIIINHELYSGSNFAGAELGHTVIVAGGKPCTCGRDGCWESYSSATGLIKITKEHMKDAPKDSALWTLIDGDINKVNGRTAFDAMRAGDAIGQAVVDEYIYFLGVGLTNMINIFQPDVVCIGGGICNEGETLLAPLREFVAKEQYAMNSAKKTVICKAELGNDAGVIGAAMLGVKV
ncbi:ROK family protein [Scatolibacter rhodanostii]|uniref:ROK family protein n=1 Tax=Scatolibacter rhodanostii TaxID=2014781 RepID=UPI000C06D342|nr:ROK family protein [Scatolibacter rhodanostii]